MLTNAGAAYFRGRIEGVSALFSATLYMSLHTDSTAPAATDTTASGELTADGLARVAVTVSHTTGTNTWTFSNTFTYSGSTTVTANKACLWDAATGGNLLTEDIISAATFNVSGDTTPINNSFKLGS